MYRPWHIYICISVCPLTADDVVAKAEFIHIWSSTYGDCTNLATTVFENLDLLPNGKLDAIDLLFHMDDLDYNCTYTWKVGINSLRVLLSLPVFYLHIVCRLSLSEGYTGQCLFPFCSVIFMCRMIKSSWMYAFQVCVGGHDRLYECVFWGCFPQRWIRFIIDITWLCVNLWMQVQFLFNTLLNIHV